MIISSSSPNADMAACFVARLRHQVGTTFRKSFGHATAQQVLLPDVTCAVVLKTHVVGTPHHHSFLCTAFGFWLTTPPPSIRCNREDNKQTFDGR